MEKNGMPVAKPTIFIVEDDDAIRHLFSFMLDRKDFEVVKAADGKEAMRMIEEIPPPDLVIMDIMLPFVDGVELTAHIREKPEWRNVPVIVLSAKSEKNEIMRAMSAGANDYLVKPFNAEVLLARMRGFLDEPASP